MRVIIRDNGRVVSDTGIGSDIVHVEQTKVPPPEPTRRDFIDRVSNWLQEPMINPEVIKKVNNWLQEPMINPEVLTTIKEHFIPGITKEQLEDDTPHNKVIREDKVNYVVLSIEPSKLTSNTNVKWLLAEISRMYMSPLDRINTHWDGISYQFDLSVWWEIYLTKDAIKFYLVVPDKNNMKDIITKQAMKTWKQSNVKEVPEYMPVFDPDITSITKLTLQSHSVLALDLTNPTYSPLDCILNAKHYLKDDDIALLQIGIQPVGGGWNSECQSIFKEIKETGIVPRKKDKEVNVKDVAEKIALGVGLIAEELTNLLGDFVIPGWEDNRSLYELTKMNLKEGDNLSTKAKLRSEGFKTTMRVVSMSVDEERRKSIIRCISSGFDPLEGDNKIIEKELSYNKVSHLLPKVTSRKHSYPNADIMCSLELAKIINVPDQKAQIEHYNELSFNTTRSESEVPRSVFEDDGTGLPFCLYEDTDGKMKPIYFDGKSKDRLCMPRIAIGEPGTGKTTFATNFSLDAFFKGYSVFAIDAADGKMVQRILDCIPPELRHKVKIIDFLNMKLPVGLGWNEAFRNDPDVIEDLLVEEVIGYIELVAEEKLNMTAKQWVENAVKAVFTTPEATLTDVECMLSNASYRNKIIPNIEDPQLRSRWEYYHTKLTPVDRKGIYEQAFRRIGPVMDKKALKNFILQKPKKDDEGNYLFDIRKWMDEGYIVLVKANESLGPTLQTALVSFLVAKFNLAMISREDIPNEEDRHPCFLVLDEPDHYIKGSERWKSMLTRYRKYRCGLTFMFHGWQQLAEQDRNLPKIIRKAGPHYIIYHTDLENLLELKSIIEPEFKLQELANGMPQYHAVIKLNMFNEKGQPLPAFMAKGLDIAEHRFQTYNNDDLYDICAKELGRPKKEVMEDIFRSRSLGSEFEHVDITTTTTTMGEGDLDVDTDDTDTDSKPDKKDNGESEDNWKKAERNRKTRMVLEYQIENYIKDCEKSGQEVDLDLIEHMDELLDEGGLEEG